MFWIIQQFIEQYYQILIQVQLMQLILLKKDYNIDISFLRDTTNEFKS